jgi:Flp pilus assembly pilin Flp
MLREFVKDESGMGVVEVILIIVVLIGLVVIFQTKMKTVVNKIFKKISSGVDDVN